MALSKRNVSRNSKGNVWGGVEGEMTYILCIIGRKNLQIDVVLTGQRVSHGQ